MKRVITMLASVLCAVAVYAVQLVSPSGELVLNVSVNPVGQPVYSLDYKGKAVIVDSRLGLCGDEADMRSGFTIDAERRSVIDETWSPVWGEYEQVVNRCNELEVDFVQHDESHRRFTVRFRLFDDGLGFRYELPEQATVNYLTLRDESTEFNLTGDHTFYCIPGDYDVDEYAYTTAPMSQLAEPLAKISKTLVNNTPIANLSVQTPLMVKTTDGIYVNIHEAALTGYAAMSLDVNAENYSLKAHLTPDKNGVRGYLQLPFHTPWRTIIVSDDARDILASQMILNLNEPCALDDTSWIKPQKFIGVWWEMFNGTGKTWAYSDYYKAKPGVTDYSTLKPNGRHPANTDNVKYYIDFAAESGIPAVLVEGWNLGWEDWAAYRKNRQFIFTEAYPDFDVDALRDYAESKGVRLIMHHETAGNAADYERQIDDAYQFMVDNGYNSLKTGYVGPIIPRSEYHSSQWMNDHYIFVAKKAAEYRIMIDSHEAVRPTGLCRTYPNWVAQESARGGEFESMGGNAPDHTCILPFTRLKGGPMDYTPGLFQTKLDYYNGEKNDQQAGTTLVRQLALYVTMPSPLQMACDLPDNYRRFPDAFKFIQDVAVDWSDSRYLEAEPGDYITVARREKGGNRWFVGAITDENERTAVIKLDFLEKGVKYEAEIYEDGKDAHWKDNPQSYKIRKIRVTADTVLKQRLASGGGVAITLTPLR